MARKCIEGNTVCPKKRLPFEVKRWFEFECFNSLMTNGPEMHRRYIIHIAENFWHVCMDRESQSEQKSLLAWRMI